MKKHKHYKFFLKTMLTYLAVLIIPLLLIASFILYQVYNQGVKDMSNEFNSKANTIISNLDDKLMEINELGYRLTFMPWVKRARSSSEIIFNQIDIIKKTEICTELQSYKSFLGISENLAIYFPEKHIIVNQKSWWDEKTFFFEMGMHQSDDALKQKILDCVRDASSFKARRLSEFGITGENEETIIFSQSLDISAEPKAILIITVSKPVFTEYIKSVYPEQPLSVTVKDGDRVIFEYNDTADTNQQKHMTAQIPSSLGYDYDISLDGYVPGITSSFVVIALLLIFSTVFIAILLAMFFARISYRPINKLLVRLGIEKHTILNNDAVVSIENALDGLIQQKDLLQSTVERYHESSRGSFVIRLLNGFVLQNDLEAQLKFYGLPYNSRSRVQVVLIRCLDEGITEQNSLKVYLILKTALDNEMKTVDSIELVTLNANQFAGIINFKSKEDIHNFSGKALFLEKYLLQEHELDIIACCGTVEKSVAGIEKSYRAALDGMQSRIESINPFAKPEIGCFFSTDRECELINLLKLGKSDAAVSLLEHLSDEASAAKLPFGYENKLMTDIYVILLRVAKETKITVSEGGAVGAKASEQWEYIFRLARQISERLDPSDTTDTGKQLLDYINEHYADSNLSLKELESVFRLSSSKIFRVFKNSANLTFYDYLCRLRIDKAKELFLSGNTSVANVSQMVGYENEASFKRAFVRYEGMRPKEYITKMTS